MDTDALAEVPVPGTAVFDTHVPAVHVFTFELKVKVWGRSQSPMVPSAHVTVLPDKVGVPFE
jgi:hypothetical protein